VEAQGVPEAIESINYEKVLHAARLTLGLAVEAANRVELGLASGG